MTTKKDLYDADARTQWTSDGHNFIEKLQDKFVYKYYCCDDENCNNWEYEEYDTLDEMLVDMPSIDLEDYEEITDG